MDDQPGSRRAALSGGPERPPEYSFQGKLEVGVFHDDLSVLAAHLERDTFPRAPARLRDFSSDLGRAREADQIDACMFHQSRPCLRPVAMDQVHDAGRDPGFNEDLNQRGRGRRRVFRRFKDHGISRDKRREDFPGRYRHRKVPRRDQPADTDGHAHSHVKLVRELRRRDHPEEPAPFAGCVVSRVDPFLNIAARLLDNFSHLARHFARYILLPRGHDIPGLANYVPTPRSRHQAP